MSATELALLVTAFGGGTGLTALLQSIRAGLPRRRIESEAITAIIRERDEAKEGERQAWVRADAMELRYDRMTASRNRWREYSHRVDAWVIANCRAPDEHYPDRVVDPTSDS